MAKQLMVNMMNAVVPMIGWVYRSAGITFVALIIKPKDHPRLDPLIFDWNDMLLQFDFN